MNELIYIVTGATGHLGSHVVNELLKQGNQVRALVLPNETCPEFIMNRQNLKEYTGDIRDKISLERIFNNCSQDIIVVHCAGVISIAKKEDPKVYEVNVDGTFNIIRMCKLYNVKRLVYISSVHAIPSLPNGQIIKEIDEFDPENVHGYYDKTKALASKLVINAARSGLDTVILHPSGIIGPYGLQTGSMYHLIKRFISGKLPVAISGGYDFVDVRDVTDGIIAAIEKGKKGECYILSNRFVSFNEIFDILSQICGIKRKVYYLPLWAAKTVAPLTELYYRITRKPPLLTSYSISKLSENVKYSHKKASDDLNYRTRSLKDTLRDTVILMQDKPRFS